jgi:hypothetical protein
VFQASTNRTCSASSGSALGPWPKLFGPHPNLSRSNPTLPTTPRPSQPRHG